jgi:hypothetical protein
MQNSELFRRGVVLPLDDRAEDGLRFNDVDPSMQVQHLPIISEVLFEALWRIGLFHQINNRCATLIDDYEEAVVEPHGTSSLASLVSAVGIPTEGVPPDVNSFLDDLHDLANRASSLKRPLFFVL